MEVATENKVLEFVADFAKPAVLSTVRQQALDALNGMDFPTRRVEEWKYTRVAKYTKNKYKQLAATVDIANYSIANLNAHQLVFVNGYFDEKASTILKDEAVTIKNIDELDETFYTESLEDTEENVFSLINKAYYTGGVFIHIAKNKKATHPIHIIHIVKGEGIIAMPRHFIHAESGAKAEVITSFDSLDSADSFSNPVLEGYVAENANLTVYKVQNEQKNMLHISRELFFQEQSSTFKIDTVTIGALLTRNQLDILVEGENCTTELNGSYLGVDKQHVDSHTFVDQMYSHCVTNELYKGVLDDQAVGVFNGMILVRPDIKKIEAYQSNKNVLLSDKADVYSKPELEIYSDDVRCSHGSTIGALDEEALYYLQARGIAKKNAEHILIGAFIGDVLEKIENEAVRAHVDAILFDEHGWEF